MYELDLRQSEEVAGGVLPVIVAAGIGLAVGYVIGRLDK